MPPSAIRTKNFFMEMLLKGKLNGIPPVGADWLPHGTAVAACGLRCASTAFIPEIRAQDLSQAKRGPVNLQVAAGISPF
jgi:hypothetical protein